MHEVVCAGRRACGTMRPSGRCKNAQAPGTVAGRRGRGRKPHARTGVALCLEGRRRTHRHSSEARALDHEV
eukprot:189087-Chlamydomonas_euryale.AAC.3